MGCLALIFMTVIVSYLAIALLFLGTCSSFLFNRDYDDYRYGPYQGDLAREQERKERERRARQERENADSALGGYIDLSGMQAFDRLFQSPLWLGVIEENPHPRLRAPI